MGRTSNANLRLMDAALSLMWEESYGAVSVDDICRRADVRKGSFYYFFVSKSDLAVKALDRMWSRYKQSLDAVFSAAESPISRIRNCCSDTYEGQQELKEKYGRVLGCPMCTLGSEICSLDMAIRDKVRELLDLKLQYWASAIADAQREGTIGPGDPLKKARCAMAFMEGMVASARVNDDIELLSDLADRMCEHLQIQSEIVTSA